QSPTAAARRTRARARARRGLHAPDPTTRARASVARAYARRHADRELPRLRAPLALLIGSGKKQRPPCEGVGAFEPCELSRRMRVPKASCETHAPIVVDPPLLADVEVQADAEVTPVAGIATVVETYARSTDC